RSTGRAASPRRLSTASQSTTCPLATRSYAPRGDDWRQLTSRSQQPRPRSPGCSKRPSARWRNRDRARARAGRPTTGGHMSRSKDIGTRAETAVVRYLRGAGWPHAERRALTGARDLGDVTGTPGIVWEVKARKALISDREIAEWMDETETERVNADAEIGVLVVRRAGVGEGNAGRWWAYLPAGTLARLATEGGF